MVFWLVLGALALILTYLWLISQRPANFPPGPPGIPFLGNVLSLGSKPAEKMTEWSKKYGDVFGMYSGRKPVVVINDFRTLRKIFSEDSASGRSTNSVVRRENSPFPSGIGLIGSQGDLWKTHRRFALSTLRDLGMGKNWMEDTIIAEVEGLCQALRETNQKPFDPKVQLTNSVSNVICAIIFGKRFELTDPKFSRLTRLVAENMAIIKLDFLCQIIPFLLWFPNSVRTQILQGRANITALTEFMKEMIADHDVSSRTEHHSGAPDYLYAYQKEKSKTREETFDELQLVGSLFDLFAAGTETTSTTILWAMVFMIENPDVMKKVQKEIDDKVGRDHVLTNADRSRLPYTEANDTGGPALRKPCASRYWKNPEHFEPNRFLDSEQKLIRPDGFVPFSIGKRACLGEALAKMELFLFIANLLRCFTLELPTGETLSHEDYHSSLVDSPNPFTLIFTSRF
ncbi:Cytochrome P450 18a1 [Hypsibius exemplaris]|uniref:Cytochrome P450 18a1 n=1 Tax=Hypsibius exemplaris TaxID=2072580 RepID=A0A1W0WLJ5_HYPEX|nr:Cytochrome P450 18a1 [Hypsibius exemplaris]